VRARVSPLRKPLRVDGVRVPGDKSISHRALLFAALAEGESRIAGLAATLGFALATGLSAVTA